MLVEKSGCGEPPILVQEPACAILSASLVVWGVLEPSGSPTSMHDVVVPCSLLSGGAREPPKPEGHQAGRARREQSLHRQR
jgi:hypothetical protein